MKKAHSAGGVIVNDKKQVVVVSQKGLSWSLPKGHLDKDEDALSAAKREIFEECGIVDLEYVCELGSYQRLSRINIAGDKELKKITLFLFKTTHETLKPQDEDNPEARWVDKEEVAGILTNSIDRDFFLSIKNKIS